MTRWIVPGATFLIGILIGFGIATAGGDETTDAEPVSGESEAVSPSSTATPESSPTFSPSPTPSPSPEQALRLTKQDVHLSLKTTEKQCFGSAGCNVSVQVRLSLDEAIVAALSESSGEWAVTYQVSGDESGPVIGTFTIYPNGKYDVNEEFLSTASTNTPIRVKVLDVERFG